MKNVMKAKDYTKYVFQGENYGKGPLVLAVVKQYLETNPETTAKELKTIFPKKETHSSFEVAEPISRAVEGRFFLNKEDIIKAADKKVAVSSQWTKSNIELFIVFAEKNLGLKIKHLRNC